MPILGFYPTTEFLAGGGTDDTANAAARDVNNSSSSIYFADNESGYLTIPSSQISNETWIHYRAYYDNAEFNTSTADGLLWYLYDANGGLVARADLVDGSVTYGMSPNEFGYGNTFSANHPLPTALQQVDVDIRYVGNNGSNEMVLEVYHDSVLIVSMIVANSIATGLGHMYFAHQDMECGVYYSEFYISTEDTRGTRVCTLEPDSVGPTSDWSGDYTAVLDRFSDATIFSETAEQRELWGLSNPGAALSSIQGVYTQSLVAKGATGPTGFQHSLVVGGTTYDSATISDPDGSVPSISEWLTNPDTSVDWVAADLDALIAGVKSIA